MTEEPGKYEVPAAKAQQMYVVELLVVAEPSVDLMNAALHRALQDGYHLRQNIQLVPDGFWCVIEKIEWR